MDVIDTNRVLVAIAEQDAKSQTEPSGAMLTLVREFAREGKFSEIAESLSTYRIVHPTNAKVVADKVPVIIREALLGPVYKIPYTVFEKWEKDEQNQDWMEKIDWALRSPEKLRSLVDRMIEELRIIQAAGAR